MKELNMMQQLELVFGEAERNWNSYVVAVKVNDEHQSYQDWWLELSIYDAGPFDPADIEDVVTYDDLLAKQEEAIWDSLSKAECDFTDECQCLDCEAIDYVELSKDL